MSECSTLAPGATLTVRVPATSANLGPGFDSLALALALYNTVQVTVLSAGESDALEVHGEGVEQLLGGGTNLIDVAMRSVAKIVGLSLPPVHLRLENAIPFGRGLGSSAAAIVSGIMIATSLLGIAWDRDKIVSQALNLENHPDNIVAAAHGGFTIGVLDHGSAVICGFLPPPELFAVMLMPEKFSSTLESRAGLSDTVTREAAVFNAGRTAMIAAAFATGQLNLLRIAMQDQLHQPERALNFPYLYPIIDAAVDAGAWGAALSGAGTSIIALSSIHGESVASAMTRVALDHGLNARVSILGIDRAGATCAIRAARETASTAS